MKVLDKSDLQNMTNDMKTNLQQKTSEMKQVKQSVESLIDVNGTALKGKTAEKIANYFDNVHLNFHWFWEKMGDQFHESIQQVNNGANMVEGSSSGRIKQEFLTGKLEAGLSQVRKRTTALTADANAIINEVSDIVSLPRINDSAVIAGVQRSRREQDWVLEDLHNFDRQQTDALDSVENLLKDLKKFLTMVKGKRSGDNLPDHNEVRDFLLGIGDVEFLFRTFYKEFFQGTQSTKLAIDSLTKYLNKGNKYSTLITAMLVVLKVRPRRLKKFAKTGRIDLKKKDLRALNNILTFTLFKTKAGKGIYQYFKDHKLQAFRKDNMKKILEYMVKYPEKRGKQFLINEFKRLTNFDEYRKFVRMGIWGRSKKMGTVFIDEMFGKKFKSIREVIGPVKNWKKPKDALKQSANVVKKNYKESVKDFNALGKASKAGKVASKGLGVLSYGAIVYDNFKHGKTTQEKIVGTAVDTALTSGAAAAGAAIGSAVVPPLGTIVGAGVGMGISYLINKKMGEPPKSIADHTKDFVNNIVDSVEDKVKDFTSGLKNIGKGLAGIFGG